MVPNLLRGRAWEKARVAHPIWRTSARKRAHRQHRGWERGHVPVCKVPRFLRPERKGDYFVGLFTGVLCCMVADCQAHDAGSVKSRDVRDQCAASARLSDLMWMRANLEPFWPINFDRNWRACRSIPAAPGCLIGPSPRRAPESATPCSPFDVLRY